MNKSNDDLVKEYLKNNEIEVISPVDRKSTTSVGNCKTKAVDLISLGEAIDFYGEKQKRKAKKKKTPDMSKINKDFIPESLHEIMNLYSKKEDLKEEVK